MSLPRRRSNSSGSAVGRTSQAAVVNHIRRAIAQEFDLDAVTAVVVDQAVVAVLDPRRAVDRQAEGQGDRLARAGVLESQVTGRVGGIAGRLAAASIPGGAFAWAGAGTARLQDRLARAIRGGK